MIFTAFSGKIADSAWSDIWRFQEGKSDKCTKPPLCRHRLTKDTHYAMNNETREELARQQDREHEADLRATLVSTIDELAQRYRWDERRFVEAVRCTLAELGANDAVQLARLKAIASELPPPEASE